MLGLYSAFRESFRAWVRSKTRPYSIEEAEEKRFFWAKLYAFFGLSSLVYCTYCAYKSDTLLYVGKDYSANSKQNISKSDTIRIIKYKGFQKVEDANYSKKELEEMKNDKFVLDSTKNN